MVALCRVLHERPSARLASSAGHLPWNKHQSGTPCSPNGGCSRGEETSAAFHSRPLGMSTALWGGGDRRPEPSLPPIRSGAASRLSGVLLGVHAARHVSIPWAVWEKGPHRSLWRPDGVCGGREWCFTQSTEFLNGHCPSRSRSGISLESCILSYLFLFGLPCSPLAGV